MPEVACDLCKKKAKIRPEEFYHYCATPACFGNLKYITDGVNIDAVPEGDIFYECQANGNIYFVGADEAERRNGHPIYTAKAIENPFIGLYKEWKKARIQLKTAENGQIAAEKEKLLLERKNRVLEKSIEVQDIEYKRPEAEDYSKMKVSEAEDYSKMKVAERKMQADKEEMERESSERKKNTEEMEMEKAVSQTELKELQELMEERQKEMVDAKVAISQLENEKTSLTKQFESSLQEKAQMTEKLKKEKTEVEERLEDCLQKLAANQMVNDRIVKENGELKEQMKEKKGQHQDLLKKVDCQQEGLQKLKEQCKRLEKERETQKKENDDLSERLQSREKVIDALKVTIGELSGLNASPNRSFNSAGRPALLNDGFRSPQAKLRCGLGQEMTKNGLLKKGRRSEEGRPIVCWSSLQFARIGRQKGEEHRREEGGASEEGSRGLDRPHTSFNPDPTEGEWLR